ncbi:hypothetical protein VTJ04DRAFT_7653 [Mycothermus thermophilus]|uniref:uncharacterized protein n=1 Tax=Humicola insolens TaxID=85995 RepID=UPI003744A028
MEVQAHLHLTSLRPFGQRQVSLHLNPGTVSSQDEVSDFLRVRVASNSRRGPVARIGHPSHPGSPSVKFRKAAKRWLKGGGERLGSEAQVPCRYTRPARREPQAASRKPRTIMTHSLRFYVK